MFSSQRHKKVIMKHSFFSTSPSCPVSKPLSCHFFPELVQSTTSLCTLLQTVSHKENQIKYLLSLKFLNCSLLQLKKNLTQCHVAAKPMFLLPSLSSIINTFQYSNLFLKTPASKSPVGLFLLSMLFCFLLVY